MQVSTKLFNQQSVNQFGKLTNEIQDLQAKVSTGKSILKSSDDPVAAVELSAAKEQKNILEGEEDTVCDLLKLLLKRKHLEGFMINDMGYAYLGNKQLNAACAIFKSNTEIFTDSPNAHDSYAEVLALKGNKKEALKHYKKAVFLAEKQNDRQLDAFKKNLSTFNQILNN